MNTSLALQETPSSSPASWQTIFWILANQSIGVMSQPGGRISGFPSRYRTYLRCSPLICGADMLSIVMRLLVYKTYLRLSIQESLGILLHRRFEPDNHDSGSGGLTAIQAEQDDGEDGIQSLERMMWLRWLWFFLGTLPSSIKLASMEGVGWAQTWGMMLLASWVMNELLIIFATLNQSFFTISNTGRISWPGYEQTTRSANYQQIQQCLNYVDGVLGVAALAIHVVIMNSIFRVMSRPLYSDYTLSAQAMGKKYVSSELVWIVSMIVGVPIGLISLGMRQRYTFRSIIATMLGGFFFIMVGDLTSYGLLTVACQHLFGSSVLVWIISSTLYSGLLFLARYFDGKFSMIGRNLLVMFQDSEGRLRIDYGAFLALIFFLSTIVTSLFWYGKMYDPTGTSVPLWTGVFG